MSIVPDCYLVDASIYVFRAWYTLPDDLHDSDGRPVNALLGFSDFVFQLLNEQRPAHLAFAFDESLGQCRRSDIYPAYKANRSPAPEELKWQFSQCRELLKYLGIPAFASPRFEADDLLGALASEARKRGERPIIITADKDLTQLLKGEELWWDFAKNKRLNSRLVEKEFGVQPSQIADLLAIAGDKVDNIPGVPGIGMTTAAKLLRRFGSLEHMLENVAAIADMKIRGAKRIQQLVTEHQGEIRVARQLTGLFSEEACADIAPPTRQQADTSALQVFMNARRFGNARLRRWLRLVVENDADPETYRYAAG
jgi:5'-3' exonuclease